jgi:hypothetical protein
LCERLMLQNEFYHHAFFHLFQIKCTEGLKNQVEEMFLAHSHSTLHSVRLHILESKMFYSFFLLVYKFLEKCCFWLTLAKFRPCRNFIHAIFPSPLLNIP